MVIMVVVGGKGTLAGPIVGGVIFGLLPEALALVADPAELQWVAYGVLMIVIVSILPNGIVPALAALVERPRPRERQPAQASDAARGRPRDERNSGPRFRSIDCRSASAA